MSPSTRSSPLCRNDPESPNVTMSQEVVARFVLGTFVSRSRVVSGGSSRRHAAAVPGALPLSAPLAFQAPRYQGVLRPWCLMAIDADRCGVRSRTSGRLNTVQGRR